MVANASPARNQNATFGLGKYSTQRYAAVTMSSLPSRTAGAFTVELPHFHGPLDLLLYLIRKQELDIHQLPIATVAQQYLEHAQVLEELDVEGAGDFLVLAATLMEIKSRLLLPRPPATDDAAEPDPRNDLVRQLLEYQRHRAAGEQLEALAAAQAQRHARSAKVGPAGMTSAAALAPVQLWELVGEFEKLVRSTVPAHGRTIVVDDTSLEQHMEALLQRLEYERRLSFEQLFGPTFPRSQQIGRFLALLELIRQGRAELVTVPGGGLLLCWRPHISSAVSTDRVDERIS